MSQVICENCILPARADRVAKHDCISAFRKAMASMCINISYFYLFCFIENSLQLLIIHFYLNRWRDYTNRQPTNSQGHSSETCWWKLRRAKAKTLPSTQDATRNLRWRSGRHCLSPPPRIRLRLLHVTDSSPSLCLIAHSDFIFAMLRTTLVTHSVSTA